MPCTHCEHCKRLRQLAMLAIDGRPRPGSQVVDVGFYRAFGAAYDYAVAHFAQPMRAIREANPDLSADRCKTYLRRARELDLVRTPRAQMPTQPPVQKAPTEPAVEAVEDPALARVLANLSVQNMRDYGVPVDARALRILGLARDEEEAQRLVGLLPA
jgi:hypothetical protein